MEIRIFQIVILAVAAGLLVKQFLSFRKSDSTLFETIVMSIFWIGTMIIALFPDAVSDTIAYVLGIKSNVNALIFFALGVLFYFQLVLYKMLKKQEEHLTVLTRKIALDNVEGE